MKVFRTPADILPGNRGAVVVIGNFDGVHRGHQALLARARVIADAEKNALGVLTFEPHPQSLFRPDEPPARLTPAPVKLWRLAACGVDQVYCLPFNWDFASQSAQDFIENILRRDLGASHIVVGHDFRFGQLRKGTPEDIRKAGFSVTVVEEIKGDAGEIFSSTAVRQALRRGDIAQANAVLGWEWEIRGVVVRGDQRGRALGYPTANLALGDTIHPSYGIYAAEVAIEGEEQWHGAAVNIGIRPMFEVPTAQVEAYIFDFDREIYGKTLRVRPIERLRGEAKFSSLDDLIAQMEKDCAQARAVLGKSC